MSDVNFSDILGFGKGIEKLLTVLSKGVGRITRSYFERKDIETRRKEVTEIAKARSDATKILADSIKEAQQGTSKINIQHEGIEISSASNLPSFFEHLNLKDRTIEKSLYQESIKQLNIENITSIAAEQLSTTKNISDEPLDDDWIHKFFSIAGDISSEEMQLLWGKILSGEIKKPRSFSLRTLHAIKHLTKEEADVIMRVGNFAFEHEGKMHLLKGNKVIMENFGVKQSDIALLIELGLLLPFSDTNFTSRIGNLYLFGDKFIRGANSDEIPHYPFTKIGEEILKLITINPPLEYLEHFDTFLGRYNQLEYKSRNDISNLE